MLGEPSWQRLGKSPGKICADYVKHFDAAFAQYLASKEKPASESGKTRYYVAQLKKPIVTELDCPKDHVLQFTILGDQLKCAVQPKPFQDDHCALIRNTADDPAKRLSFYASYGIKKYQLFESLPNA
ncbi:hypothetical protein VARIO8X_70073 [Burkholderiales bacterium 8X]|nr:hypothetical protein VARIO8X_70073 [Burkholderiales bacterium 8X]